MTQTTYIHQHHAAVRGAVSGMVLTLGIAGAACHGDLLTAPPPATVTPSSQLQDSVGGEALALGAVGLFATGTAQAFAAIRWSGTMADEFFDTNNDLEDIAPDARSVNANGVTAFDRAYVSLQHSRTQALQAISVLEHHGSDATTIGEMFAIVGYAEVLLAENVCSGVPLSDVTVNGQITDGDPLPVDSLLTRAAAAFDSAASHAHGDTLIGPLAATGKGRALLDLGRYGDAGAAVTAVASTYVYTIELSSISGDIYEVMARGFDASVADNKGTNGLNFISAHDARVPTASVGPSGIGTTAVRPLRFASTAAQDGPIPLADGVEAELIRAEAALDTHDVVTWLGLLNDLRANFVALRGPYPADTSYHQLGPLADPGTDGARVDLLFRERAFWLYGTDHRLGDLRRLVRQYGRAVETVFPTGAYVNGIESGVIARYGLSVNFPLGTVEQGNPKFHGCLSLGA